MSARHLSTDSPWLLGLLAAIVALGPLSVDMYLPAMPSMMRALGTDISAMHLSISTYLAGYAIFHLACGPLADRFGRKPILTAGTALFVVACLGCAQSDTVGELLIYRFLQGVGACVGPTLARTVTRDLFGPRRAARALSLIAMLMALGPAIAPLLGGFLLLVLPWPIIFIVLAAYALAMIVLLQTFLPESLPEQQSLHPLNILGNYGQLCMDVRFMSVVLASGLVYAGLMAYLSSSSYVYMELLGVPVQYFGFIFLTTVVGYMGGSGLSARLASRLDSHQMLMRGATLCTAAAGLMWLGGSLRPDSVAVLMLPMAIYAVGMGLVYPHALAIALAPYPHMAGTASSLLGFIQMGLSGLSAALVGQVLTDSAQPMLMAMFGCTFACLVLSRVVARDA
ncbi:MFS transporter [Halioglobus japonicus]|uniref:Bcr/CflA family efflux transporter n=1 Tax=Halioglobus japonicus TaxID=930805 RepID=A0AAP8SMM6_9GAMM|nr:MULTISPECIES: multidrug effflux MFS transporter [Halioglobus]AQA17271.1 MFS transporter [Halioglobus japonicus]KZX58156.1 multidrug transporter [Halioglobus sp. HI00S01]PLW85188.1 MFS transporter [Halioglobus japonicus]GHD19917.1 Bcr/CflA family drug resistance efflux transporter [Halioglobus japonicus]